MDEIVRLRNIAWEAIGSAMVDRSECDRYWRAWMAHCRLYPKGTGSNPTAREKTDRLLMLLSPCRKATTASEIKSRFSQSSGLCGMSPKGLFWTDTLTHAVHHRDNTPLTYQ
jgi:hypothetical protein